MSGVEIGLGVALGWAPGRFKVFDWITVANAGSTLGTPMAALADSSDLSIAMSDAANNYIGNNTDTNYMA
jgi:hypothetical protein